MKKTKNKKQQRILPLRWKDSVMKQAVRRGVVMTAAASFLICGTLGLAFYWFLLSDMLESKNQVQAKVEKKEGENQRGQAIEKSMPQFEEEFRKLVSISDEAEPLLPNETDLSNMLVGVQEIARRDNVTLVGLTAAKASQKATLTYYDEKGEVKPADKVYEREIPAQVAGDYANVVRFFYDLKQLSRIMVIRDFGLYAKTKNSLAANFTLMIYHAPPSGEMKPLPAFLTRPQQASNGTSDVLARNNWVNNEEKINGNSQ